MFENDLTVWKVCEPVLIVFGGYNVPQFSKYIK